MGQVAAGQDEKMTIRITWTIAPAERAEPDRATPAGRSTPRFVPAGSGRSVPLAADVGLGDPVDERRGPLGPGPWPNGTRPPPPPSKEARASPVGRNRDMAITQAATPRCADWMACQLLPTWPLRRMNCKKAPERSAMVSQGAGRTRWMAGQLLVRGAVRRAAAAGFRHAFPRLCDRVAVGADRAGAASIGRARDFPGADDRVALDTVLSATARVAVRHALGQVDVHRTLGRGKGPRI